MGKITDSRNWQITLGGIVALVVLVATVAGIRARDVNQIGNNTARIDKQEEFHEKIGVAIGKMAVDIATIAASQHKHPPANP